MVDRSIYKIALVGGVTLALGYFWGKGQRSKRIHDIY